MSRVFDTTNTNYLVTATNAAYNFNSSNALSVAFWWKKAADGAAQGLMATNESKDAQLFFDDGSAGAGNKLTDLGLNESVFLSSGANTVLVADGWVHIAFTHNATSGAWVLYKNGVSIGSGTSAGTFTDSSAVSVYLGKSLTLGLAGNGKMAYAAIWKSALSGANVTSLQTSTTPESIDSANCVGSWYLNGAGGSLTDHSATANDMTVQGTVAGDADDPVIGGGGSSIAASLLLLGIG
jgi:hypothetical protein